MSFRSARKSAQSRREARIARQAASTAPAERGAGVNPELWIHEHENQINLSIRFSIDGADASISLLPDADRVMRKLRITAWADTTADLVTLFGYQVCRLDGYSVDVATMDEMRPVMRRIDRFLEMVVEESGDDSFAKVADSLAAHLRVTRVVHVKDGEEREIKRGATYLHAHKLVEAFLALHAKAAA